MKSPAFLDMGFSSRLALLYFFTKLKVVNKGKRKAKDFHLVNNGEIVFSYREAESLGFTMPTFRKILLELQEHGFLEVAKRGFGGVGDFKATSEYRLIETWRTWKGQEQDQKQRGLTAPTRSKRATPLHLPPQDGRTSG